MTHEGAPAVFVIHEVAAVRPSWVRGLWKDFLSERLGFTLQIFNVPAKCTPKWNKVVIAKR
jgi:hypothetical protein